MRKVPLLFFAFLCTINFGIQTEARVVRGFDRVNHINAFSMDIVFRRYNMKFCPKIFKVEHDVEFDGKNWAASVTFQEETVQAMETCCDSILQCDMQKRAESNGSLIEEDIRHCECENKFRECVSNSDNAQITDFGSEYFRKTAKCYSMDHPIIKCEQYKCFYQPNEIYNEYPSKHFGAAVRCVEYQLDKSKPKIYQTFELPFYYDEGFSYNWLKIEAEVYDKHDTNKFGAKSNTNCYATIR